MNTLTKSELAHVNAEVVNDAEGRRLRLTVVDDKIEGFETVCVVEIPVHEIAEMLAGDKYSSVGLWR